MSNQDIEWKEATHKALLDNQEKLITEIKLLSAIIKADNCICSGPGDIRCARCKAIKVYDNWKLKKDYI